MDEDDEAIRIEERELLEGDEQIAREGIAGECEEDSEFLFVAEHDARKEEEAAAAKQAELLKTAFEKAVANSTELAEMVATSNAQTSKLISARITESLDDIRKQAVTLKKKK